MVTFSDEELIDVFSRQLPDLLERRPELEPVIYQGFMKAFVRREEVAVILDELRELRAEIDRRFEQVDRRFEQVEGATNALRAEMNQRFAEVEARMVNLEFGLHKAIDRLGSRWGIRNEIVFRKTIATLLEESFGVKVEQCTIAGEQFDVVIYDHQHILIEIAAISLSKSPRAWGAPLESVWSASVVCTPNPRASLPRGSFSPRQISTATGHKSCAIRALRSSNPKKPDYSKI